MRAVLSVVVPAHNEGAVIGACLDRLLAGTTPGEFEVVVVCNGCTDDTAERARSFGDAVRVLETPVASKPHALNLGDAHAQAFPRAYLDSDVLVPAVTLRRVVAAMEAGGALAGSCRVVVDCGGSSWPVAAYHRIWSRLPVIADGMLGRGLYVLSKGGRQRFGAFPDIVADDYYVHSMFAPHERVVAADAASTVQAPRTARDLVRRKARVFAGNAALRAAPGGAVAGTPPSSASWLGVVRREPRLAPDALAYALITLSAKARARYRLTRGGAGHWDRDDSSRAARA